MEIFGSSQFPLCWALHSTRTQAIGEPPPVSLLSQSRGGLVNDGSPMRFGDDAPSGGLVIKILKQIERKKTKKIILS